jgi:NAD+ synthase
MTKKSTLQIEKCESYCTLVENLRRKCKVNGFVIGISGGVDSAVTSTLCAQTGLQVYV